jgi:hypothetical protein
MPDPVHPYPPDQDPVLTPPDPTPADDPITTFTTRWHPALDAEVWVHWFEPDTSTVRKNLTPLDSRSGRVLFIRVIPTPPLAPNVKPRNPPAPFTVQVLDLAGHLRTVNDLPYTHPSAVWIEVIR